MRNILCRWAFSLMCCGLLLLAMPLSASASGGTDTNAEYNIEIISPSGVQTGVATVAVRVEDVGGAGFSKVEALPCGEEDWVDITDSIAASGGASVDVTENSVLYVAVTDPDGYIHIQAGVVECFGMSNGTATTGTTTESAIPSGTTDANPFTPEGTGTVLDNATGEDEKEFFTITTADENVFYLIVERQRNSENVYFLNAVTENDLLSLAQPSGNSGESAIPVEEVVPTPEPDPDPEPEPEPEPKKSKTGSMLFILIAVAAVGGAGYYFKIVKPRQLAVDENDEDDEDEYADEYADTDGPEEYLDELPDPEDYGQADFDPEDDGEEPI